MEILTIKESQVLYLKEIEGYTQEEISEKLNYSIRQIQRINKSAQKKIINLYIAEKYNKKPN